MIGSYAPPTLFDVIFAIVGVIGLFFFGLLNFIENAKRLRKKRVISEKRKKSGLDSCDDLVQMLIDREGYY